MSAKPTLVVMAAGIGSRYGGLKQVDPVGPGGENIIDYSVYDAIRAGFGKVVFIIRKEIEEVFREKVGHSAESRVDTAYVFQEISSLPAGIKPPEGRTKPWGTAHAALCAKAAIPGPAAVINADDFYGFAAFKTLAGWLSNAADGSGKYSYSMIGYRLMNTITEHGTVSRGCCTVDALGRLTGIVERTKIKPVEGAIKYSDDGTTWKPIDGTTIVSMNMWGFTPSYFSEIEKRFVPFLEKNGANPKAEYFIPSVVDELIKEKKATVDVLTTDAKWFGITYKEDRERVAESLRAMVADHDYPEQLWH